MDSMTMGLWTTLLVTASAGIGGTGLGGTLATLFRRDSGRAVSYTHQTLPTTPYV